MKQWFSFLVSTFNLYYLAWIYYMYIFCWVEIFIEYVAGCINCTAVVYIHLFSIVLFVSKRGLNRTTIGRLHVQFKHWIKSMMKKILFQFFPIQFVCCLTFNFIILYKMQFRVYWKEWKEKKAYHSHKIRMLIPYE